MADECFAVVQQLIQKTVVNVTVLKVINPIHYVIKEAPSQEMSSIARDFVKLDEDLNYYYNNFDKKPCDIKFPSKGSLIIVKQVVDKRWYRARVNSVLETTKGPYISVYLVDYGQSILVESKWIRSIPEAFLEVPFQAVAFHLLGLLPLAMEMNSEIKLELKPSRNWDIAAKELIHSLINRGSAKVEVRGTVSQNMLYGKLYIEDNGQVVCINEKLVDENYAYIAEDEIKVAKSNQILELKKPSSPDNHFHTDSTAASTDENILLDKHLKAKKLYEEVKDFTSSVKKMYNERNKDVKLRKGKPPSSSQSLITPTLPSPSLVDTATATKAPSYHMLDQKCFAYLSSASTKFAESTNSSESLSIYNKASSLGFLLKALKKSSHSSLDSSTQAKLHIPSFSSSEQCASKLNVCHELNSILKKPSITLSSYNDESTLESTKETEKSKIMGNKNNASKFLQFLHKNVQLKKQGADYITSQKNDVKSANDLLCGSSAVENYQDFPIPSFQHNSNKHNLFDNSTSQVPELPISTAKQNPDLQKVESFTTDEQNSKASNDTSEKYTGNAFKSRKFNSASFKSSDIKQHTISCEKLLGTPLNPKSILSNSTQQVETTIAGIPVATNSTKCSLKLQTLINGNCNSEEEILDLKTGTVFETSTKVQNNSHFLKNNTVNNGNLAKNKTDILLQDSTTCFSQSFDTKNICSKKFNYNLMENSCTSPVSTITDVQNKSDSTHVIKSDSSTRSDNNTHNVELKEDCINKEGCLKKITTKTLIEKLQALKLIKKANDKSLASINLSRCLGTGNKKGQPIEDCSKSSDLILEYSKNNMQTLITPSNADLKPELHLVSDETSGKTDISSEKIPNDKNLLNETSDLDTKLACDSKVNNENLKTLKGEIKNIEESGELLSNDTLQKTSLLSNSVELSASSQEKEIEYFIGISDDEGMEKLVHINDDSPKMVSTDIKANIVAEDAKAENSSSEPAFKPPTDFNIKIHLDFTVLPERHSLKVLKRGHRIPNSLSSVEKAPFVGFIKQRLLEVDFVGPTRIQSAVWPAVFRGRNVVSIDRPHSGKTLAYLLPLLSHLLQPNIYDGIPSGKGPLLLILSSTWKKAQIIHAQCQHILKDQKQIKVLVVYSGLEKFKHEDLVNGCNVLISTPPCLMRLLNNKDLKTTDLNRCCHLMLDDGNELIENFTDEIKEIVRTYLFDEEKKKLCAPLQILLCCEHWTKGIASFMRNCMVDALLFISYFLEAAIYGHLPTYVQVCSSLQKNTCILDLLDGCRAPKIVICTSSSESSIEVYEVLKSTAKFALLAHDDMPHFEVERIEKEWNSPKSPDNSVILVITDNVLVDMNIFDATCIIHYDIPDNSRFDFGQRFCCLVKHFPSLEDILEGKGLPLDYVCHILVTEDNCKHASSLISFLKKVKEKVPPKLIHLASICQQNTVGENKCLCHYFKAFGHCPFLPKCDNRHEISAELDKKSEGIPGGDIIALVTYVLDASHYYVRILKYYDHKKKTTVHFNDEFLKLKMEMSSFYSETSNHIIKDSPDIGDFCALKLPGGYFYRIQVKELTKLSIHGKADKVKVHFIDEGQSEIVDVNQLLILPNHLSAIPPQTTEVYICHIKPPDNCYEWTPQANSYVHSLIANKEIAGRVILCLGNTLWLQNLTICKHLKFEKQYVYMGQIASNVMNEGYAVPNPEHINLLYKACEGKVALPVLTENTDQDSFEKLKEISHAFLEMETFSDVYVSAVTSPQLFYVQQTKFSKCLDELLDDISKQIVSGHLQKCTQLHKGMHILAPFQEDNKWYRACIEDTDSDGIKVFYPDFGDSGKVNKENIYIMPSKFELLPYQAVECELSRIVAPHGGWSDQAVDSFWDLCLNSQKDSKILILKALKKNPPVYSGSNHYIVELYDTSGDTDINIADELVNKGVAVLDDLPECAMSSQTDKHNTSDSGMDETGQNEENFTDFSEDEKIAAASLYAVMAHAANNTTKLQSADKNTLKEIYTVTSRDKISEAAPEECNGFPSNVAAKETLKSIFPEIRWWQTVDEVKISILLIGIEQYNILISAVNLKFSTFHKGQLYLVDEQLFADIDQHNSKVNCTGRSINITLKKHKASKWPRLVARSDKMPNIKVDCNHLETESDSEENKPLVHPKWKRGDAKILPYETSEEERSSEFEEDDWQMTKTWDPYDVINC